MITSNFKIRTNAQSKEYAIGYARMHCKHFSTTNSDNVETEEHCNLIPENHDNKLDCDGCVDFERK
jgi:hypothetical protein